MLLLVIAAPGLIALALMVVALAHKPAPAPKQEFTTAAVAKTLLTFVGTVTQVWTVVLVLLLIGGYVLISADPNSFQLGPM